MNERVYVRGRSGYLVSRPNGWYYVNHVKEEHIGVSVLDQEAVERYFGRGYKLNAHSVHPPAEGA